MNSGDKLNFNSENAIKSIEQIENAINLQKYIQKMTTKDIVNLLYYLNHMYHNEGKQPISDTVYDMLKNCLEDNDPKHSFLSMVGAPVFVTNEKSVKLKKKVELPYFMGSLNKIKTNQKDIDNWVKKHDTPNSYVLSDKLDGISIMYVYENMGNDSWVQSLYTRGDGKSGQDISSILKLLNFSKVLKFDKSVAQKVIIRGELIIKQNVFDKKYQDQFSNPRNMISGMVFKLEPNKQILNDVDYIAYEVVEPVGMTPSEQFEYLKKLNFKVPFHQTHHSKSLVVDTMSKLYIQRKKESPYEIDGIVVKHNSIYENSQETIKWGFAFKDIMTNEQAQVVVNQVEWNISKDGLFKPKVLFNPTKLEGSMIKQATAHNAKFIFENRIGPGAKIIIIKSGSVIPKIQQVIEGSLNNEPQMPPKKYKWKWNSAGVEAVVEGAFDEVKLKEFQNFFNKIKIDGFSDMTIERLYKEGYNTIPKLRALTVEKLMELERFQKKSATNLINGLKERFNELEKNQSQDQDSNSCALMMVASNQFGNGLGMKRAQLIIESLSSMIDKRETPPLKDLIEIEGISDITATKIIIGFKKFYKWLEENQIKLPKCNKIVQQKNKDAEKNVHKFTKHQYYGKNFAFSGFRDKELQELLRKHFMANVVDSVNKKVLIVVAKNTEEYSSKLRRAKELGLKIVSYDTFNKTIQDLIETI